MGLGEREANHSARERDNEGKRPKEDQQSEIS